MKISHIPQSTIPNKIEKKVITVYNVQSVQIYIAYLQKIQISKVPKLWTLIPTFLLKNDKKV